MSRPKKDCTPITVKLEKDIFNRLSEYSEISGQSKTVTVERALKMYIDAYEQKEGVIITGKEKPE